MPRHEVSLRMDPDFYLGCSHASLPFLANTEVLENAGMSSKCILKPRLCACAVALSISINQALVRLRHAWEEQGQAYTLVMAPCQAAFRSTAEVVSVANQARGSPAESFCLMGCRKCWTAAGFRASLSLMCHRDASSVHPSRAILALLVSSTFTSNLHSQPPRSTFKRSSEKHCVVALFWTRSAMSSCCVERVCMLLLAAAAQLAKFHGGILAWRLETCSLPFASHDVHKTSYVCHAQSQWQSCRMLHLRQTQHCPHNQLDEC